MASSPSVGGATDAYAEGWRQLQEHLRNGQSWSGNERHCVFLNTGTPHFADASAVTGLDFPDDGRGLAVCDWDHDGDLDLWFTNRSGPRARFLRNESVHQNDYIALRLRSPSPNRDAIGAEVELFFQGEDAERHVRTLRAGSGFISQSSKWVHFGVPAGRVVSHVAVRWPAGETTEHRGLHAGARWLLHQDNPQPQPVLTAERAIAIKTGALPSPPFSTAARIPIIRPLPLLGLRVESPDGRRVPVQPTPDSGVLLTLWADWCVNCKRELAQLQANHELLQQAGLRVLAVSVDDPADRAAGDAFLDKLSWSFERAYAHEELLSILSIAQRVLLDRPHADSIPTSYLLDGSGRLQVIYRGPVDAAQLVTDSKSFDKPPLERRKDFAPFPGWWSTDKIPSRYTIMAIQLRNHGFPSLSAQYLKRITIRGDVEDAPEHAVNRMVGSEINTGVQLMQNGDIQEAAASFRRALNLRPQHPIANKLLGSCLQRQGRAQEAAQYLQIALEADPDDAETCNDLGLAQIDLGRSDDAERSFRRAVELDPKLAKAQFNLGVSRARANDLSEATPHIQEATRLDPNYTQAWVSLGRIHSIQDRLDQAIPALQRALELHDSDPEVLLLYADCLIRSSRPAEARALLPQLRRLDPTRATRLEQLLAP